MLVKAELEDIAKLTAISKVAFDTDILVGASETGGPPNYDSVPWHKKMMLSENLFSFFEDGILIGGELLFRDRKAPGFLYIGRIFIDPQYNRKGYGLVLMRQIEELYPSLSTYRLETPVWNIRTHAFYEKCGYREMLRDQEFVYFQKKIV